MLNGSTPCRIGRPEGRPREFVIRNIRENVQEIDDGRRLVTDAEGNRFILPHPDTLDPASRRLAERCV
jgi:hypothetical protein